jgi:D-alanine-D-alanine ligase
VPWRDFDVCFIALHGGPGEDGTIQAYLEGVGIPYTSSGPTASRLAISKSAAKERFLQAQVATLPYVLAASAESPCDVLERVRRLGYPLIVKPDAQGSSLGVGIARSAHDLPLCLNEAARLDEFILIEPFVAGREFTVAVIGRQPLPLLEIIPGAECFDFNAKYGSPEPLARLDHGLRAAEERRITQAAVAACQSLGTRGLARVDVIADSRGCPWVLEVNTIPGLTRHSLAPLAAGRVGLDLGELCEWMLQDAQPREVHA